MVGSARLLPRVIALVGMLLAPVCPPGAARDAQAAPAGGSAVVELEGFVRAVQGDTLDARMSNRRVGIGIIGIQAPLGNTPCGKEATAFLQGLINDGARVEEEPGLSSDGRYRRMYHVTTLDGRSVAEEVVAAGFARADGQGANRDRLAELEGAAREARRGCLWRSGGTP